MLEFSSVSVSSYDAASLAGKLTEKSSEGWDVVAIVSAGTNVTAYLSRGAQAGETGGAADDTAAETPAETAADTSADISADTAGATFAADEESTPVEEQPAATSFEPVLPATAAAAAAAPPVEEPAGWAAEPEPATPATDTSGDTSWSTDATTVGATAATVAAEPEPVAPTPEPEPEPVQAAAAAVAPAGWYADPSGRYELRYWDGSQWTEHVSRAGQQYTDPPVA